MRIVSGSLKGRIISVPSNFKLRPTTDLAKESLFNILQNYVDFEEISVLDLFGGTGGISYEFASRGCENITTVERNYKHYSFIKKTIDGFNLDAVNCIKSDVFDFLENTDRTFDLIFADPPYDLKRLDNIPTIVFEKGILNNGGILILEHPQTYDFSSYPYFSMNKKYGAVNFSFFEPED